MEISVERAVAGADLSRSLDALFVNAPYDKGPNALRQAIEQIVEAAVHGIKNPSKIDNPVRDGSPTIAIERTKLNELQAEIDRLKVERADDLVSAAKDAEPRTAIALLRQSLERNPYNFDAHFFLGSSSAKLQIMKRRRASYVMDSLFNRITPKAGVS